MKKYLYVLGFSFIMALSFAAPSSGAAQVPTLTATVTPTIDPYYGECPVYPEGFDFASLPLDYVARCSQCFENLVTLTPAPTSIFPTVEITPYVFDDTLLTEVVASSTPDVFATATITPTVTITPTSIFSGNAFEVEAISAVLRNEPYAVGNTSVVECFPSVGSTGVNIVACSGSLGATATNPFVEGGVVVIVDLDAVSYPNTWYYKSRIFNNENFGTVNHRISSSSGSIVSTSLETEGSYYEGASSHGGFAIEILGAYNGSAMYTDFEIILSTSPISDEVTPTPTPTMTPVAGFCTDIPELTDYEPIVDTDGLVTVIVGECWTLLPPIEFDIPAVEPIWEGFEFEMQGIRACPNYVTINSLRVGDISIPDGLFAVGLAWAIFKLIF